MKLQCANQLEYFVWGENPKLLLWSGMHGDEHQTCDLQREYLSKNYLKLPSFLYIPVMSPSAYTAKCRTNKNGNDLNRCFVDDIADCEVSDVKTLLSGYKFDLGIDFHEDLELDKQFYLMNYGNKILVNMNQIENRLYSVGVELYNGEEDPSDPLLQKEIKKGYLHDPLAAKVCKGFIADWLYVNKICSSILVAEIPMKANVETKRKIIDIIFASLNFV